MSFISLREKLSGRLPKLYEALSNVPDDAEVYMDDGCSVTAIPTDYAEYTNVFMIH